MLSQLTIPVDKSKGLSIRGQGGTLGDVNVHCQHASTIAKPFPHNLPGKEVPDKAWALKLWITTGHFSIGYDIYDYRIS